MPHSRWNCHWQNDLLGYVRRCILYEQWLAAGPLPGETFNLAFLIKLAFEYCLDSLLSI